MLTSKSGKIDGVFSKDELVQVTKYLSNLPIDCISNGNSFTGISQEHMLYSWFCKKIFNKIKDLTSNNIQLLFGSYLNEKTPWNVHCDYYHKLIHEPYKAFLIPISVNEDINQVEKTNTIIFNEEDTYVSPNIKNKEWSPKLWNTNKIKKENNARIFFEEYLSHESINTLECLTINNILNWKLGSVLHWDENLLHCSDNFIKNNISSKQAIVMHTYTV